MTQIPVIWGLSLVDNWLSMRPLLSRFKVGPGQKVHQPGLKLGHWWGAHQPGPFIPVAKASGKKRL